jgi:hypothetical protein
MPEPVYNQKIDTKIVLSSRVFDLDGFVPLKVEASSQQFDKVRRVTRTATLDGGAFITDFGYTDSDRTMTFQIPFLDRDGVAAVEYLMRTYAEIGVATYDGFYVGVLSALQVRGGILVVTIFIKERLSGD